MTIRKKSKDKTQYFFNVQEVSIEKVNDIKSNQKLTHMADGTKPKTDDFHDFFRVNIILDNGKTHKLEVYDASDIITKMNSSVVLDL